MKKKGDVAMWPGDTAMISVGSLDVKSPFFVSQKCFSGQYDLTRKNSGERVSLMRDLRHRFTLEFREYLELDLERWEHLAIIWGEAITNACLHSKPNSKDLEFVSFAVTTQLGQMVLEIVNSTDLIRWVMPDCQLVEESGRGCCLISKLSESTFSGKVFWTVIPQKQFELVGFLDL